VTVVEHVGEVGESVLAGCSWLESRAGKVALVVGLFPMFPDKRELSGPYYLTVGVVGRHILDIVDSFRDCTLGYGEEFFDFATVAAAVVVTCSPLLGADFAKAHDFQGAEEEVVHSFFPGMGLVVDMAFSELVPWIPSFLFQPDSSGLLDLFYWQGLARKS
jgi:hypothetical protein